MNSTSGILLGIESFTLVRHYFLQEGSSQKYPDFKEVEFSLSLPKRGNHDNLPTGVCCLGDRVALWFSLLSGLAWKAG